MSSGDKADAQSSARLSPALTEGPWAGWSTWTGSEPFEENTGPFYVRREPEGAFVCGFRPKPSSLNGGGFVHGGAIATFADYSLFMIAHDELVGKTSVTVALNVEFVNAAPGDKLITTRGDVLKAGRSLLFVRGVASADGALVANFSGVLKLVRQKT